MTSPGIVEKLISCLKELQSENARLSDKLTELEKRPLPVDPDDLAEIASERVLPTGIVIASIQKCNALAPSGSWIEYEHGYGRVIVGAGQPTQKQYQTSNYPYWYPSHLPKNDENRRELTIHESEASGGEEIVALTERNLPPHSHSLALPTWQESIDNGVASNHVYLTPNSQVLSENNARVGESSITVTSSTANEPFQNMPPFIALYYCKKN